MTKSLANESPRSRFGRRVGAAVMALAAVLVLGACRADGGGFVGDPLDGGTVSVFQGDAEFGFTFFCEMEVKKNRPRAVIRGEITYHDSPSSITLEATSTRPYSRRSGCTSSWPPTAVRTFRRAGRRLGAFPSGRVRGHLPASGEGPFRASTAAPSLSSRCST